MDPTLALEISKHGVAITALAVMALGLWKGPEIIRALKNGRSARPEPSNGEGLRLLIREELRGVVDASNRSSRTLHDINNHLAGIGGKLDVLTTKFRGM